MTQRLRYVALLVSVFLLLWPVLSAQQQTVVSSSRSIDWSQAGVVGGIPARTTACATLAAGASAATINNAIAACPSGQVVQLGAGTYFLSSGIVFNNKSNVTLRGAGPDATFLVFTAGSGCFGVGGADICLMSSDNGDGYDNNYTNAATWVGGHTVGSTSITLGTELRGSLANLKVGSLVFLDQLDDTTGDTGDVYVCQLQNSCATDIPSANGRSGRGQQQPVIVTSISGSTIGITPGIRMPNIRSEQSPQAWWDNHLPIQNDGIENLSLDHTSTKSASGILIVNGRNNWVKNVRDINTRTSTTVHKHIWLYQTIHTTIRDSYFYGSNPSSEGYGVDTYNGADTLHENNIFQHMAIPMITEGCIGCVMGYNYSFDDYYTSGNSQWQQASGAYHHSIGDAFVLSEGNIGIGLTSDTVHGTSNFGTAFRNYWNGRDPAGGSVGGKTEQTNPIILNSHSRYYNVIGNVIGTAGYHTNYTMAPPSISDRGTCWKSIYALGWGGNCASGTIANDTLVAGTLMRWGNYDTVTGAVKWDPSEVPSTLGNYSNPVPTSHKLPASFYLPVKPTFFTTKFANVAWPPIGPDVTGGIIANVGGHANKIPAQLCYENTPKTNGIPSYNANNCYDTASLTAPTNLRIVQ
jgi:hypothetical protein